jgi:hypothetical protein
MSKSYHHPGGAFSLTLPDNWDYSIQNSTIAFFQPANGVGAINVSVMIPAKCTVDLAEVALEFAPKSIRPELQVTDLESAAPGAYVEYEFKSNVWRVWTFCGKTRVLVVSYNCQSSSKGIEDSIVNEIIRSVVVG